MLTAKKIQEVHQFPVHSSPSIEKNPPQCYSCSELNLTPLYPNQRFDTIHGFIKTSANFPRHHKLRFFYIYYLCLTFIEVLSKWNFENAHRSLLTSNSYIKTGSQRSSLCYPPTSALKLWTRILISSFVIKSIIFFKKKQKVYLNILNIHSLTSYNLLCCFCNFKW